MTERPPDPKSVALALRSWRGWQVGVKVETAISCDRCGAQIVPHTFYWWHNLHVRVCDSCFDDSTDALNERDRLERLARDRSLGLI